MPKGPTKRRPETRARMLDAAMAAFADIGFGGATIDEICRRAGYTTGAFYSNFASKDDLFYALFDAHADRALDRLVARLSQLDDIDMTAERIGALWGDLEPEERAWFLVSTEFTLYAIRNPAAAEVLAIHDAKLRREIIRVITVQFKRLNRIPTVNLDELARLMVAIREGGLAQSLIEPAALPSGTLERRFFSTLLEQVSTPA